MTQVLPDLDVDLEMPGAKNRDETLTMRQLSVIFTFCSVVESRLRKLRSDIAERSALRLRALRAMGGARFARAARFVTSSSS